MNTTKNTTNNNANANTDADTDVLRAADQLASIRDAMPELWSIIHEAAFELSLWDISPDAEGASEVARLAKLA